MSVQCVVCSADLDMSKAVSVSPQAVEVMCTTCHEKNLVARPELMKRQADHAQPLEK